MIVTMGGLDHTTAPVELREQLSFDAQQVQALNRAIAALDGVSGAVLLSTCNRTELYLSAGCYVPHPGQLLCQAAGRDWERFREHFVRRQGEEAARHLMEVAAGLHSRIWGEEQIVTQVRQAMERARAVKSADGLLNTLFQRALTAGKAVQTRVTFTAVPGSAASQAVELVRQRLGGLEGRRALVIGNGEMGRLSARLLQAAGAEVIVTLRRYRHRETVVPHGCTAVPYEDRLALIDGADVLFSATTSPHYTFTAAQARSLRRCPPFLIDLAIPRDMEPEAALPGVELYNVDDFGVRPAESDAAALSKARAIVEEQLGALRAWKGYRDSLPAMAELKAALGRRLAATGVTDVQQAADRSVELLLGGLRTCYGPEDLLRCAGKIDAFTRRGRRNASKCREEFPFPLFLDLRERPVVVVGGGAVARRRIDALLSFGARVTVIAPTLRGSPEGLDWQPRQFQPGDTAGAALVVAATDRRAVNRQVGREARGRGIPVSVADAASECTFFFPALCRGERVLAGVCSRGADHGAVAKAAASIRLKLKEEAL